MPNNLWRDFPKTATEFEARFATEEDCRAYRIEARWGGEPACARCTSTRVWTIVPQPPAPTAVVRGRLRIGVLALLIGVEALPV